MKLRDFLVMLAYFWPKYLEAIAMAMERQMSELALFFWFFQERFIVSKFNKF